MLLFALVGFGLFRERTLRARLENLTNERRVLETDNIWRADEWEDQPEVRVQELENVQKRNPELGSDSTLLIPRNTLMRELDGAGVR